VSALRLAGDAVERLREAGTPYDERAFFLVLGSIEYLQRRLPARRHVSGGELSEACREFALEQYGLLTRAVLEHWGITRTEDFGRIVFALVEAGLLVTQPGDRIEDFRDVYDFGYAFDDSYVWEGVKHL